MQTVKEGTNSHDFIRYITPMIGRMRYYTWPGGIIPPDHGPYAHNGPAPRISYLRSDPKIFCAGVSNLALRLAGKRIPIAQYQSLEYDGGIAAYWGTPVYNIGAGYFTAYMEPFHIRKALRWARDTRTIVLAGWKYTGVPLHLQGHVFLIFPSGWILESTPSGGLDWTWWEGSYAVRNATVMVHPKNWLEYTGDKVHRGGLW